MKRIATIETLAIKIWGMIESSSIRNRESFRQGVIDSIVRVLQMQDATIEYIGYRPDHHGTNHRSGGETVYEDCVFLSLDLHSDGLATYDQNLPETIIDDFIRVFEDNTHHHLEIDSTVVNQQQNEKRIEMISDWKFYLKQG